LHFILQDIGPSELKLCIARSVSDLESSDLLFGILLASNGTTMSENPAAGKVALRLLGKTARDAAAKCIVDLTALGDASATQDEDLLKAHVAGYLEDYEQHQEPRPPRLRETELRRVHEDILPNIRNVVPPDAVPLALIMDRALIAKVPKR